MTTTEIISLIVTLIGIISFSSIFTILYGSYASMTMNEIRSGKKDIDLIDEIIYQKRDNVIKRRKIWGYIKTVAFSISMAIIVPIFIVTAISKFTNNPFIIGTKSIMVVASGSMSEKHEKNDYLDVHNLNNQFDKYDIIIIEKVKSPVDIKMYDVVAYTNEDGVNIIHRIVSLNPDGTYDTKGDANEGLDPMHPRYKDVLGEYTGKRIKGIGIFIIFFQSYSGMITILSLIYCVLMLDRISNKINKVQDERADYLENVFDFTNEDVSNVNADYSEVIYYKGFAYHFKNEQFVKKIEITNDPLNQKIQDTMIKEIVTDDSKIVVEKEIEKENKLGD